MIRLKKLRFAEYEGTPQEWVLEDLSLGEANLIVGKNAAGKTRTLSVIKALALLLSGAIDPPLTGNFDVEFTSDNHTIRYILNYEKQQVIEEKFIRDKDTLLDRKIGGEGTIYAEQIGKGEYVHFQAPPNKIAAVVRQDNIQHTFLQPLDLWGSSLRHYQFGSPLGKDHLAILSEKGSQNPFNDKDPDQVVILFRQAEKMFGDAFKQSVIKDMNAIGYDLENLGIGPLVSMIFSSAPDLVGLFAKEKYLPGITDQHSMSQGMFRALSLLIQVNYSNMAERSSCILVDDIGEGLDFDRSCMLIDLLLEKSKKSTTQLVLSTNDRFIMDRVPLEEWSVLQRKGNHVHVLNYGNSRALFEEFKFTGLSNFSFLEMDFASGSPAEDDKNK